MPKKKHPQDDSPQDLVGDRDPWLRQPRENPGPYSCFVEFRDLQPLDRTLAKTAVIVNRSPHTLRKWSRRWRWADRARAYDFHKDEIKRAASEKKLVTVAERQANELAATIGALLQPAKALLERLQEKDGEAFLKKASFYDLARLVGYVSRPLPKLIEAERMVHGLPARTERREHTGREGGPIERTNSEVVLYIPDNGRDKTEPDDDGAD